MKFASILLASLLILVSPWMIGGNYLYFRTVLLVLAALVGTMAALSSVVEQQRYSTSLLWLVIPIAGLYAIYQTLPVSGPISIYPSASKEQLVTLVSAITLFLSSTVLFRGSKTIGPLMFCIGAVGFAVAFIGVVQKLGWNGKVLWVYDLLYGGQPFGPFVNKNNAAGYLILTLAGPMYFISRQLFSAMNRHRSDQNIDSIISDSGSRGSRKRRGNPLRPIVSLIANLETKHLYAITGLVVIVAGVFISFSRGGSISVMLGLSAGILTLMIANRYAVVLAAIVIVCCVSIVVWTEQADAVQDKLATITEVDQATEPRLLHWKDALPYYQTHWLLGSGLGTYRYEYPFFQRQPFQKKFAHAESLYLETLAELGIGGVVALLLTILVLFYSAVKLFRQPSSGDRALGVAAITALVGVSAASFLDFGIYQPANFILAAILFGAVVGRAGHPMLNQSAKTNAGPVRYFRFVLLLLLVVASAYATFPSAAVESVKAARRQIAQHIQSNGQSVHRLTKAKKSLLFAEKYLPEDWQVPYLLGQCEIFQHRIALTEQVQQETEEMLLAEGLEAGMSEEEVKKQFPSRQEYWGTTSMLNLHRVMRFTEAQGGDKFRESRNDPKIVTPELEKAWDFFTEAVSRCDRSERIHYRLAQLTVLFEKAEGNRDIEAKHIDNALRMANGYTGLLYDAGMLSMNSGRYERAAELWADCISKTRRYEKRIVQFGLGLPAKLYFEKVLPQNPDDLLRLARRHFSAEEQRVPNELMMVHTRRLINNAELADVKKWELTGKAWFQAKQYQKACEEFEHALAENPDRPRWRVDYANCLAKVGRYDEAIVQLTKCRLEHPDLAIRISRLVEKTKRERIRERKHEKSLE